MHLTDDTIVALSTPSGSGAIGVVRLSGDRAIEIAAALMPKAKLPSTASHTARFGKLYAPSGELLDEVVATIFRGPRSYTSQDIVEISCHGSSFIIEQVLDACLQSGARLAQPGEFTMRAYLNGSLDLAQAEAVADLIAAESSGAHQLALDQLSGGVSKRIAELRVKLIDVASLLELELDFGEEDVEFADRTQLNALLTDTIDMIESLLSSFTLGNAIKEGVKTVLAGKPNAGKSTLLNTLLDDDRAIVSDIAGTTRDTIEELLVIDGIPFRLIDTAGIRDAADTIEALGVERTLDKINTSAVVLYLVDASATSPSEALEDIDKLQLGEQKLLVLLNKADQASQDQLAAFNSLKETYSSLALSAQSADDVKQLKSLLLDVIGGGVDLTQRTIITNQRHVDALRRTLTALDTARNGLGMHIPSDLVALDLRAALNALGEITGAISADDLLGSIFGRFCIGK